MDSKPRRFKQGRMIAALVGTALTCSACATVPQTARSNTPEDGAYQAIYKESSKEASNSKSARRNRPADSPSSAQPSITAPQTYRDPAFQQIGYDAGAAQANLPQPGDGVTQAQLGGQRGFVPECPIIVDQCPPEPRFPAAGPNPMAPGMVACDVCNLPSPESYADEYLCDGGDRGLPVNLDTEDTVLKYVDRDGKEWTKPSNRVCVYAPRFSSVRTVTRPHEEYSTNEIAGVDQLASTKGLHTRLKPSHEVQRESLSRVAIRSRASGLEMDTNQSSVQQLHRPSANEKVLNLYQALTFVQFGMVDERETAKLQKGMQAAVLWTRDENPVIAAKVDMAVEGFLEQTACAITVIDQKEGSANLRIVKLADKKTALPGDVIEFTIRFDNVGTREARDVRIVDNLTPRLAYVDGSATCDQDGQLLLQDNGEGSLILTWELAEPLKGKSGGVVTFKARVR